MSTTTEHSATLGHMPWEGYELDEPVRAFTPAGLTHALGLDWKVEKRQLINGRTGEPCRNFSETIRVDTGETLGIVKPRYTVIQNEQALGFLPEVAGRHGLSVHAGGTLDGGAKAWVLAKLRETEFPNRVLPNGEKDRLIQHLLFWWSHDGSSGRRVAGVGMAFWCANALMSAWNNAQVKASTRHTRNAAEKLFETDRDVARAITGLEAFQAEMIEWDAQPIKRTAVRAVAEQVLDDVYGAIEDAKTVTDPKAKQKLERKAEGRARKAERITALFEGEGVSCRGESKYDAYQALTEFIDHHRGRKATASRFGETLLGYNSMRLRTAALQRLRAA